MPLHPPVLKEDVTEATALTETWGRGGEQVEGTPRSLFLPGDLLPVLPEARPGRSPKGQEPQVTQRLSPAAQSRAQRDLWSGEER